MQEAIQPILSIVVAVYNVEPYLTECLESILLQSHPLEGDIEIVCVDDGSTDGSAEILSNYAASNPHLITVIHQKNAGLSAARNTGMRNSHGEYIFFLDGDDLLNGVDTLSLVLAVFDEHPAIDIAYFDARAFPDSPEDAKRASEMNRWLQRPWTDEKEAECGLALMEAMTKDGAWKEPVWTQVFRRSLLYDAGIAFVAGALHEDLAFSYCAAMAAGRVVYIPTVILRYRIRADSITGKKPSAENATGCFSNFMYSLHFTRGGQQVNEGSNKQLWRMLASARQKHMWLQPDERRRAASLLQGADAFLYDRLVADEIDLMDQLVHANKQGSCLQRKVDRAMEEAAALESECNQLREENRRLKREVSGLNKTVRKTNQRYEKKRKQYDKLKSSLSFRIGRNVTAIPRLIRGLFRGMLR
jgi:glycosyltransferase involved in cell wall biosynthesis/FtsZ-binding cell division protein ZapB